MSTGELHAIAIQHGPERGHSQCDGCEFHEDATSHVAILDMKAHTVQHAMSTGHRAHWSTEGRDDVQPL